MATNVVHQLTALHAHAIDARHGYEEALDHAEHGSPTSVFTQMIDLHSQNASDLATDLIHLGVVPDASGSFMTTVHHAIMDIRSLFGGLDQSVLPGLIDGEGRNVAAYERALAATEIPADIRTHLEKQKARLDAAISGMHATMR